MPKLRTIFNAIVFTIALGIGGLVISHATSASNRAISTEEKAAIDAKAAATKAADTTTLSNLVTSFAAPQSDYVGVVVTDLSSGATATSNADKQFVSASLYKLYVAYDVYKKIDNNTISLNQSITTADNTNTVSGCLNLMITISDNDCGAALGDLVGWSSLDSLLASEGYTGTMLNNYDSSSNLEGDKMTTAHDVALLLSRLYDGTLLSKSSSDAYLTLLKAQTINDRLPTGLPDGTVIAHKTGDLYGYLHDAGIIYSAKKNMLVVLLTGDWDSPQADGIPLFTSLATQVWTYSQE